MLQAGHNFVGWSAVEILGKREGGFDRQLVSHATIPVLLQVQERGLEIRPMFDKARSYQPERKRLGNQLDTCGWIPTVDERPIKAGSRVFQISDTASEPTETCVVLSSRGVCVLFGDISRQRTERRVEFVSLSQLLSRIGAYCLRESVAGALVGYVSRR